MEVSELVENLSKNCVKMQKKSFSKGSIITTYIEKRKQICILLSGKADLIRYDLNGNKDIIDRFSKNDIFGEAFYPVNNNNELFALATEPCEVLLFLYDDVQIKCRTHCRFHTTLVSHVLELVLNNVVHQNTRIRFYRAKIIVKILFFLFLWQAWQII